MKNIKLVSLILVVVMLLAMIPVGILPTSAAEVTRDEKWLETEMAEAKKNGDKTLHIKDAADLLAFAYELNNGNNDAYAELKTSEGKIVKDFDGYTGNTFYGMTIKLEADIILNEGWDALSVDPFAETRQVPDTVWPVESEKYFAGTFDGQGHVISGLYQSYLGKYVGLFGNVKGGTQATVKNLIILNSYIQGSSEGIGTIFGVIYLRPNCLKETQTSWMKLEEYKDGSYSGYTPVDREGHTVTRGTIDNVYISSKVVSTGDGRTHTGTGGFVGGNNSELVVTDSVWTGEAIGGVRGVGGVVGQVRSLENTGATDATSLDKLKELLKTDTNYADWATLSDTDLQKFVKKDGWGYYWDQQDAWTTVRNVYLAGNLVGANSGEKPLAPESFVGGIVGYSNNAGEHFMLENVISNSTFDTRVYTAEGEKVYVTATAEQGVSEFKYLSDTGYLYGGNWGSRNRSSSNVFSDFKSQQWFLNNVTYVETSDKILYGRAVGRPVKETEWYFPQELMTNENFYKNFRTKKLNEIKHDALESIATTAVPEGFWTTDVKFEMLQYTYDQIPVGTDKYWSFKPLGLDGKFVEDAQYTLATTNGGKNDRTDNAAYQLMMHAAFKQLCATSADSVGTDAKWTKLLADKGFEGWTVVNGMPMIQELADIVKVKEAADIPSATPTPDASWYENQKDAKTLEIYNADDLLAFQTEIAKGTSFKDKTVVLMNDFALNADMKAEKLHEIVELNDKTFEGTFDGRNHTISGLYLNAEKGNIGLFGNVAKDKTATVKNLKIENSTFTSKAGDLGVLFGDVAGTLSVSNVWIDATVTGAANAGALAGDAAKLTVKDVVVYGTVKATAGNAGGVVGNTADVTATDVLVTATVTGTKAGAIAGNATKATLKNILATSAAGTGTNVFVIGKDVQKNDLIGKAGEKFLADKGMTETWAAVGMNPMPKTVYDNFYEGLVGYSISVGQKISVNMYVKLAGASSFEGSFKVGTSKEKKVFSELQENGLHKFTYENLAPERMIDEIVFTSEGFTFTTSVKNYLVSLLSVNPELASALLRWGEAAQNYGDGYKTDKLATAGVTGLSEKKDTTADITNDAAYTGTESAEYKVLATNLFVTEEGTLKVSVKVRFQDISGRQCLTAITGDRAEVNLNYSQAEIVEDENRTYTMIFSNIDLASMNDDITLVLKDKPNGTELSQTLTTSLNGMIADFMASDADQADKDLVAAMHAVGTAIAAAN